MFAGFASLALSLGFAHAASAWTGPTASPPSANVSAPLNVSTGDQIKHGWIGLDSMSILNHLIISGAANSPNSVRYLNFGSTWDSAGYGVRDNAGTLEFKNAGGTWASIQSTVSTLMGSGSQWATSGSNIYYNTGNVGIGIASPAGKLESDSNGAGVWAGMFNYSSGAPNGAYGIWTYGTSYALYAQGPIVTTGNINIGSAVLATNGDLYMPWKGQWLSTVLSNLPGRLGGQFWVNTGTAQSTCPSGSVMAGTYVTSIYGGEPAITTYSSVLCQWITQ